MIDYETFVKIKFLKDQHALKCRQIARELNLDYRTVYKWLDQKHYQQRKSPQRASKLDPFKGQIVRMLQS
jgi:transposase